MEEETLHDRPLIFDDEQQQQIDRCLLHLADQIGSPLVMLVDISGRLVQYRGRLSASQSTGLAALAAGGFAAGKEVGAFLGLRNSFKQQLLEGDLASLFISSVGSELLLIVAFTKQTMLGMVRLFGRQAQQELFALAKEAAVARERDIAEGVTQQVEPEFSQELNRQLNELFSDEMF